MGLVSQAFERGRSGAAARRPGDRAHPLFHHRQQQYQANASPFVAESNIGEIAVAHNGNLTNADRLRDELIALGEQFVATTDSEVVARLIARQPGSTIVEKIRRAMPRMLGAYSLTILTPGEVVAVRDPLGVRPLCLGRLADGGNVVASESCALSTIGAQLRARNRAGRDRRHRRHRRGRVHASSASRRRATRSASSR